MKRERQADMEDERTTPFPHHLDEATVPDGDAATLEHVSPSGDVNTTVTLDEFCLTRDQVVGMFAAAGIKIDKHTISRYGKEKVLRAKLVDAERGLKRYLFNLQSVEEYIAKRLRGPDSVYAPAIEEDEEGDDGTVTPLSSPSRHGSATMTPGMAPSHHRDRVRELEIEVATLKGRMTEKERQHDEDTATIIRLRDENGQLRLGIGEYKGRATELERRLALLEAPKAAPEPEAKPEAPKGLLRCMFGRK